MEEMKKMLMGLTIVAAMVAPGGVAGATGPVRGDANCSGAVGHDDVQLLIDVILEKPGAEFGDCGAQVDLNCDGTLNVLDVTRLRKLANGYTVPECTP